MDPTNPKPVIDAARELADTYAETQLWGVIAFFSVLVVVQFLTMIFLLLKKDKAYVDLIHTNSDTDKEVSKSFDERHREFVDVLKRSMEAINKNSAALSKLFDKLSITDSVIDSGINESRASLKELQEKLDALSKPSENKDV